MKLFFNYLKNTESSSYKCQYCGYTVNDNYCASCRSRFELIKKEQKHISVEMDVLEYLTLTDKLCFTCTKYYKKNKILRVTSFINYYKKLGLCSKCKKDNEKFIRNMFYKNFMLNRQKERIYTWYYIVIFMFSFLFYGSYGFLYILHFISSFLSYSFVDIFICLLLSLKKDKLSCRLIFISFNFFKMITMTKHYFYMPINLEKDENIDLHIKKLTIT